MSRSPTRFGRAAMLSLALLLTACAGLETKPQPEPKPELTHEAFRAIAPRSILIVPVVNESLDVDAGNYLLSTLPIPLAERGYYVFPVNTVKTVLEQEGFYEGAQIHQQPPQVLANLFNADAILYLTIKRWDAKYVVLAASVTVQLEYRIVAADGTEIWRAESTNEYSPRVGDSDELNATGLIIYLIAAAATRASPDYLSLAQEANYDAIMLGPNALPYGPYAAPRR